MSSNCFCINSNKLLKKQLFFRLLNDCSLIPLCHRLKESGKGLLPIDIQQNFSHPVSLPHS